MTISEQNARYYLAHRGKLRARAREYYKTHGEAQREYHRRYYKAMSDDIREKKRAHDRAYYKVHPEKWKEYYHKIQINHPERNRENFYKWRYSISLSDYRAMVVKQEGKCLICEEVPKRKLYIDHEHETGKVRGLICNSCNLGLGHFRENPKILARAIDYLAITGEREMIR